MRMSKRWRGVFFSAVMGAFIGYILAGFSSWWVVLGAVIGAWVGAGIQLLLRSRDPWF
jgi:hypothetical protein